MSILSRRSRWLLLACLLAFDAVTLPAAAVGVYIVKSAWHIDFVPGVDMLPDDVLQAGLDRAGAWLERWWAARQRA